MRVCQGCRENRRHPVATFSPATAKRASYPSAPSTPRPCGQATRFYTYKEMKDHTAKIWVRDYWSKNHYTDSGYCWRNYRFDFHFIFYCILSHWLYTGWFRIITLYIMNVKIKNVNGRFKLTLCFVKVDYHAWFGYLVERLSHN